MSYIDVITLDEAKNYLRVDDDLTEDDNSITAMINAALRYIENYTNVLVYARDKEYDFDDITLRVYDYPINDTITADVTSERKSLYTNYCAGTGVTTLDLNVGYVDPADVPDDLKLVALDMIEIWYYMQKGGEEREVISPLNQVILDSNKRFIL